MKILSIVGARPQFIKLGPLSKEIRKQHDEIIIHTGQHFDKEMSEQIFYDLKIPKPDYNLKIRTGQYGIEIADTISKTEQVILKEHPDFFTSSAGYADYEINVAKENSLWVSSYNKYEKIFSNDYNVKKRLNNIRLLFETLKKYQFAWLKNKEIVKYIN